MEIIKICMFAILGAVAVLMLKDHNPSVATVLTIACSVAITLCIVNEFYSIVSIVNNIIGDAGIDLKHIKTIFKIVIIGYIAQITTDIIDDMGIKSLSTKVSFSAKIIILGLCVPILNDLFLLVSEVL